MFEFEKLFSPYPYFVFHFFRSNIPIMHYFWMYNHASARHFRLHSTSVHIFAWTNGSENFSLQNSPIWRIFLYKIHALDDGSKKQKSISKRKVKTPWTYAWTAPFRKYRRLSGLTYIVTVHASSMFWPRWKVKERSSCQSSNTIIGGKYLYINISRKPEAVSDKQLRMWKWR